MGKPIDNTFEYEYNKNDFYREINALKYDTSGCMTLDSDLMISKLFYEQGPNVIGKYIEPMRASIGYRDSIDFNEILKELESGCILKFIMDDKSVYFMLKKINNVPFIRKYIHVL